VLAEGMKRLGFKELLDQSVQGYIITSYYFPKDPNFNFTDFYNRLNAKGKVKEIISILLPSFKAF
jgi:hypothetical protein